MLGTGFNEVDEAGAAIEFGKKESSIGLSIRGFDPIKARLDDAVITAAFAQDSTPVATHPHDIYVYIKIHSD